MEVKDATYGYTSMFVQYMKTGSADDKNVNKKCPHMAGSVSVCRLKTSLYSLLTGRAPYTTQSHHWECQQWITVCWILVPVSEFKGRLSAFLNKEGAHFGFFSSGLSKASAKKSIILKQWINHKYICIVLCAVFSVTPVRHFRLREPVLTPLMILLLFHNYMNINY